MRLWHCNFLPYLDDFHIKAQWREVLAIKGAIDKNGTPNHRLVNKVLDYNIQEFKNYTASIVRELRKRNINFQLSKWEEIFYWDSPHFNKNRYFGPKMYEGWFNLKYLRQNYYNLEEKFDCGIVSKNSWEKIDKYYNKYIKEHKEK